MKRAVKNITTGTQEYVDINTMECPYCHIPHVPELLCAANINDGHSAIISKCTNENCSQCYIINHFKGNFEGYTQVQDVPTVSDETFDDEISKVSPQFCKIYNQAHKAEYCGLDQVAGVGYRKALEFLIKDYLIYTQPEKSDTIKGKFLGNCITDDVTDANIKAVAKRAAWLGNDETHYVREWENKDISDLKQLILLCCRWIASDVLTKTILEDMPENGRK